MQILYENEFYKVENEYETVYLYDKIKKFSICTGDFYGDVYCAEIDKNNKFLVMCGCGIIIYYLKKPFKEYSYNTKTSQWKEFYRNGDIWFEKIKFIDNNIICVEDETSKEYFFEV